MSVIITGRGGRNHTTEKRNLLMKFEILDQIAVYQSTTVEIY